MSDSDLGRKWDRCLADTVVKIGKGLLAPGRPGPEPRGQRTALLPGRAEGKLPERSGRPACSSPSGQGELPEPGREVTRAVGAPRPAGVGGVELQPRGGGGWVGRWQERC